jgi:hypothetical protein
MMQVFLFQLELYIQKKKKKKTGKEEKNDAYLIVCLNLDRSEKKSDEKSI